METSIIKQIPKRHPIPLLRLHLCWAKCWWDLTTPIKASCLHLWCHLQHTSWPPVSWILALATIHLTVNCSNKHCYFSHHLKISLILPTAPTRSFSISYTLWSFAVQPRPCLSFLSPLIPLLIVSFATTLLHVCICSFLQRLRYGLNLAALLLLSLILLSHCREMACVDQCCLEVDHSFPESHIAARLSTCCQLPWGVWRTYQLDYRQPFSQMPSVL